MEVAAFAEGIRMTDFNTCTVHLLSFLRVENLCNLARRRFKLPDDDKKMSKHVGV